jgi:hypothetical protein
MDVKISNPRSIGQLFAAVALICAVALFFSIIGFVFGNGRQQKALYDAQSEDAKRVSETVKPKLKKLRDLYSVAQKHDGTAPDPEVVKSLAEVDFALQPEEVARDKLLLGETVTALLMRYSSDSLWLASNMRRHQTMTNKVDKKELEELIKESEVLKSAGFAVAFNSGNYIENQKKKGAKGLVFGRLLAYDGKEPDDKGNVKLRSFRGDEVEWSQHKLVLLPKSELKKSKGPNALRRYERRHKEIEAKLKEMSQYGDSLVSELSKLSNRPPAPMLSF